MKSNLKKILLICLLLISGVPALLTGFISPSIKNVGNEAIAQSQGTYNFSFCTCNGCGGLSGYPNRGGQCISFGGGCLYYALCG